jgi:transcriptional regulator with XRE-family HTH domain
MRPKPLPLKIREAREKRGLSQAALSDLLHIPPSSLCRYEKGIVTPSATRLRQIATALRCPIDALY